jgi:hypothetical protein
MYNVFESLAHLIGTISFYMQELWFDSWTLHLFTLWVDFQATRLPDKKNKKYLLRKQKWKQKQKFNFFYYLISKH